MNQGMSHFRATQVTPPFASICSLRDNSLNFPCTICSACHLCGLVFNPKKWRHLIGPPSGIQCHIIWLKLRNIWEHSLAYSLTLKDGDILQNVNWLSILENRTLHKHCLENLKSKMLATFWFYSATPPN